MLSAVSIIFQTNLTSRKIFWQLNISFWNKIYNSHPKSTVFISFISNAHPMNSSFITFLLFSSCRMDCSVLFGVNPFASMGVSRETTIRPQVVTITVIGMRYTDTKRKMKKPRRNRPLSSPNMARSISSNLSLQIWRDILPYSLTIITGKLLQ